MQFKDKKMYDFGNNVKNNIFLFQLKRNKMFIALYMEENILFYLNSSLKTAQNNDLLQLEILVVKRSCLDLVDTKHNYNYNFNWFIIDIINNTFLIKKNLSIFTRAFYERYYNNK